MKKISKILISVTLILTLIFSFSVCSFATKEYFSPEATVYDYSKVSPDSDSDKYKRTNANGDTIEDSIISPATDDVNNSIYIITGIATVALCVVTGFVISGNKNKKKSVDEPK